MRITWRSIVLAAALGSLPMASYAAPTISMKSVAETDVEVMVNGLKTVKRAPVDKAVPGTAVIFTTTFENLGKKPASNIVINNPIPNDTEYQAGSAFGENTEITFSIDGGKNFSEAERLKVKSADGTQRIAPAKLYTHIRWSYKGALAAGAQGSVGFKSVIK